MANYKQLETKARTWATGHVVAAVAIGIAIGFVLGLILT